MPKQSEIKQEELQEFDIGKCLGCECLAPDESGRGVCWHLEGELPDHCQLKPSHTESKEDK